jgi:RNA polymerase sigma-70 factor (ECF subfamily)
MAERSLASTDDEELARWILETPSAAEAEAELFRRLAPRLLVVARRHVDSEARAADLAQDAVVVVLEALRERKMRDPKKLHSFVFGVCRRMASDRRRGETLRESLLARYVETPRQDDPTEPEIDLEALERCIQRLSARERGVLAASFWADQSAEEIARGLSMTPGNVRVIRHRAVRNLSRCLGDPLEPGR